MSKRKSFGKFYKQKSRARKSLTAGSFTPLQIVRCKGSSLSNIEGNRKGMELLVANIDKPIIFCKTSKSDCMDLNTARQDEQKLKNESHCRKVNKVLDLKCDLPVIKKSIIIPETQTSDDEFDNSCGEEGQSIVENKSFSNGWIDSQKELQTAMTADSDFMLDIIPGTYDISKNRCGIGGKAKIVNKSTDSRVAEYKINKPPKVKPPVSVHTDAKILCTNDVSMKNDFKARLKELKYKPANKEKEKLARLRVKVRHEVPPQHKVESTAGSHAMTLVEEASFRKYALLKQGKFDKAEDEKIKENWKTFCKDNGWDPDKPEPFLLLKHDGNKNFLIHQLEDRKNFVRCLAHDLPNRCLNSVHRRFKNLYVNLSKKKDNYTDEEDKQIVQFLSAYPDIKASNERNSPYAKLGVILKRTRDSVWRRSRILKKKMKQTEASTS